MRIAPQPSSLRLPARPARAKAREWLALFGACAVIGPAILGPGCSGSGASGSSEAPNAGLEALASGTSGRPAVRIEPPAPAEDTGDINLSEVLDRARAKKAAAPAAPTPSQPQPEVPVVVEAVPPPPSPAPVKTEDASQRVKRLASELRVAVGERAGTRPRFSDAIAAAVVDSLSGDSSGADLASELSPGQRRVLDAFRTVLRAVTTGSASSGDPTGAADAFTSAAASLDSTQGLHIRRTELCSRVSGFGRYQAMGRNGFLAGRPARFIIYTEIDRFGHRPARDNDPGRSELGDAGGDVLAVELTQELALWQDADGSQQWRHPAQTVVEVSRNRRHDFYLVQQVELPQNLSVGKYNLKVTVRDGVSGAQDEAQIPIVIVADPALIQPTTGR